MADTTAAPEAALEYEGLISITRLAAWLDVSDHTVKKWVQAGPASGRIPRFLRVNGQVRFRPSDVSAWLDRQVVE